MRTLLHDRVDEVEELREQTRELVQRVFRSNIGKALRIANNDMGRMLELLAEIVGNELAGLTTEAASAGYDHAIRRTKKKRG